jgi:hypothetical protein
MLSGLVKAELARKIVKKKVADSGLVKAELARKIVKKKVAEPLSLRSRGAGKLPDRQGRLRFPVDAREDVRFALAIF